MSSTASTPSSAPATLPERVAAHAAEVSRLLASLDPDAIGRMVDALRRCRLAGGAVYVAGNGGSAANASHGAAHLSECGVRAVCLTDSAALLTAMANDHSYAEALVRALPGGLFRPEDVALVFSCSGNSPNIRNLAKWAKTCGATALGVFGFKGVCRADRDCDLSIVLDSMGYEACEDVHSSIVHLFRKELLR